ncbi:MAG: TIGR02099 family protein [Algicola sp.]|nr:TIGR02099 family protein [Algicola sp.]
MKIDGVCFFCIKKMWQLLAILLVITAVVISLLKYTLPHIGSYGNDIQDWVRTKYGAEIYIGSISAGWEGNGPAILLQNISFLPNESAPLDLVIKETRIKLDFWKSIKQLQLTSDYFILDGVIATIDGRSLIQNSDAQDDQISQIDAPILDALSQLFLGRLEQFSMVNSEIILNTPSAVAQHIAIEELTWSNDKLHHQGVGRFKMGEFAANSLSFVLDLTGDKRVDLTGQLFIEATELDISQWLHQFVSSKTTLEPSNINFKSWATITNGLFERAQISLGDNEVVWERDDVKHHLTFGKGQMIWVPAMNGWEVSSNDIEFSGDDENWPRVNLNLTKEAGLFNFYFSEFSTQRAIAMLSLLDVDTKVVEALDAYQPSGLIHDFFIRFDQDKDWQLTGLFDEFGWNNVGEVPGANRLSGHFGMTADAGWLKVEGVDGYLLTGDLFKEAIYYENIEMDLSFLQKQHQQGYQQDRQALAQRWQLHGDNLWFHNGDIDFVGEFSLELGDEPTIAVYGELSGSDLSMLDKYYPPEYLGQDTIDYLNGAIKGGNLDLAQLLWSGKLDGFPYAKNEGVFVVNTLVSEVDFLFTPGWPVLSGVDAELIFRNDSLTATPKKGYFLDIDIANKAVAVIPELSESLWVDLVIDAVEAPQKLAKLFKASPLRDTFNPVFEAMSIRDEVHAKANIRIPLVDDDAEFTELLDYQGEVIFANNALTVHAPGIDLTDVSGVFKFDSQKIWADEFNARWLGQAFKAKLKGWDQPTEYKLAIDAHGLADISQLEFPLKQYVNGKVPVSATIDLDFPLQGIRYIVNANADLTKMVSTFPKPYEKALDVAAPLTLNIKGDEISALITANYDNRLYFNGILPNEEPSFTQAHLILADRDMGLAGDGFKVSVDLDKMEVMPWYNLVDTLVESINAAPVSSDTPLLAVPRLIDGRIGELDALGILFHGVKFDLTEGNGSWDLSLNAKETRTIAHIDRDWDGQGITIKTEYLRLANDEDDHTTGSVINSAELIAGLPPIDFQCMDCQYGDYNLARVDIETTVSKSKGKSKLNITKLNITKGKHQFQATGEWIGDRGNGFSTLTGRLTSDDIGNLLSEYDITSTVRDSDARLDVIANWAGGPHQFNLPSLSGEVKWRLGEGHLTEISDQGSRIFSLLSFDSIVRKLKLDFRDVFSKGFFYNNIKGSMLVESGIAYTDNTEIDGLPGNLTMQGNVNLIDKKLDYNAVFAPKITSSLPVIIGWMINPISGIAALALDKMLESTKVVAQIHFDITGTISEPVVTETERKSREIKLPKTAATVRVMPKQSNSPPSGKFAETELELEVKLEPIPENKPVVDNTPTPVIDNEDNGAIDNGR